ncbi:unnamed protein product [Microthlaspi erraticum]|uniref:Isopenicillin N synthase-like Fe(2+) 2OG dioxygenase domain-containing protein n=1 Tax=Microthlaspi erraticum TaxID=1685480 RepID=A0A6D2K895_9BRAS|nr:unnamed protein product [Microthlaspi erraticum]
MEAKGARLYSSIIVPSVQEMVKDKMITTVPLRYVRSDLDKAEIADDSVLRNEIPIIDMNRLCSSTSMDSEIDKLDFACKEWGFFQASLKTQKSNYYFKTHSLQNNPSSFFVRLLNPIKISSFNIVACLYEYHLSACKPWNGLGILGQIQVGDSRFVQPSHGREEEALATARRSEGFGQAFVVSEEQKLDWADLFLLTMQPIGLRKPHVFPKIPLPIRDTLETYSDEVKSIAKILFAKMASALKIKPEEMESVFDDELRQRLRVNYYPPCPQPDQVIGLTPHSDATGLTILLQIVTNGTYRSIEHRGVVNSEKERLSVALFHIAGWVKNWSAEKSRGKAKGCVFQKRDHR